METLEIKWVPDPVAVIEVTHHEPAPRCEEQKSAFAETLRAPSQKVIVITQEGAKVRQCIQAC
jgi:hypothetical protein